MPIIDNESVLSALTVRVAMRRFVCHLDRKASIRQAIRHTIKYKVNAVLITDEQGEALGVVTKTNVMGAYYVGLPITSPLEAIMVAPPLFCHADDSLDAALDQMRKHKVHRLYVFGDDPLKAIGVLAYPDVLGILYRYCHKCERSKLRPLDPGTKSVLQDHFKTGELMNPSFRSHAADDTLMAIMESISTGLFKTVLIKDETGQPLGVVSTTDLIIAYMHDTPPTVPAKTIMTSPVRSCSYEASLSEAIHKMIFLDLHSLYIHKESPENIVGIISLADAARIRSGSCRACTITRIDPDR